MSRKIKREMTSLSFSMNRLYHRVSTARPSTLIISLFAIGIAVFLFGGGLYDIIVKPYPAVYYGGYFHFFDPRLSEQFVADSAVAMILYALGVAGILVMYQSTKYAYRPRQAYMMFLVGVVLLFLAYIYIEVAVQLKLSGGG